VAGCRWASPSGLAPGPTHLVVGDASGMINPFNGEGIAYGYETGRLAAGVPSRRADQRGPGALRNYEERLQAEYGLYYRVGRAFVRAISRPPVMRACTATGMYSRPIMEWLLRIMSNMLRPDELGPAEAAYKTLAAIARAKPPSS